MTVDLTALAFDQGIDWDANRTNDTFSRWTIGVSGGGTATPNTATHTKAASSGAGETAGTAAAMTLSGLTGLTDTTVTFTITSEMNVDALFATTGSNDNARQGYLDNLVITGAEVVPEPSSVALLGLGGLALTLRRRRL